MLAAVTYGPGLFLGVVLLMAAAFLFAANLAIVL